MQELEMFQSAAWLSHCKRTAIIIEQIRLFVVLSIIILEINLFFALQFANNKFPLFKID
jgi:hypothetical protein